MGGTLKKQTEVRSLVLSNLRALPDMTSDSTKHTLSVRVVWRVEWSNVM